MITELPKNWIETNLGTVTTKPQYGWTTKSQNFGEYKYLRTTDIGKGNIKWDEVPFCVDLPKNVNDYILNKNDIVISRAGSIGFSYLVEEIESNVLYASYLIRFKPLIYPKLISYFLQSNSYWRAVSDNAVGIAVKNINAPKLQSIPFPLPPLQEQERIVAKLDALFAKHEAMKKALERIPQLLKDFRQQVLTQAMTGDLTKNWRIGKELSNVFQDRIITDYKIIKLPVSWSIVFIEDFADVKGGKRLPKGSEFSEHKTDYPYIRARDLKFGTVLMDKIVYISEEVQKTIKNYIVRTNDLYITIVGAKIGDAGSIPKEMDGANLTENAAKLTNLNKYIYYKYISYFLRSEICQKNISETIMSAAQGKLALTRIKKLPVYLPSLKEQQEIVSSIESLFSKADKIEKRYKTLKEKIDSLPQAILNKAFKGELVPQLPTDGDAKDLLEEILKLKKEVKKK